MGTSLRMIEATYGHLATDAASRELDILDAYDEEQSGRGLDVPSQQRSRRTSETPTFAGIPRNGAKGIRTPDLLGAIQTLGCV
jgi:hypothetical protein